VHPNPDNIILHTRLVGEMNGLLEVLTVGTTDHDKWGKLASPRAYTDYVQPKPLTSADGQPTAPAVPQRRQDALSGTQVIASLTNAEPADREAALANEILQGNTPTFWRSFANVTSEFKAEDGKSHTIIYRVSPDYLAVGSDDDFVRVPLTPYVAQHIADMLGCVLLTRKMVDDVYRTSEIQLAPQPMTEARESLATFLEHNRLIEKQGKNPPTGQLVAGIKKDVVVTNELLKRPGHVAIYGWHQLNGKPIQPLTTVHVDWYVDYSHGIRLVDQWCEVDGKTRRVQDVLRDKDLCGLLSDEGPLEYLSYQRKPKL